MTSWRDTIEIHPLAADFPPMSEDELRELGEDIKKQEQLTSPIAICVQHPMDDTFQLVDGCNRLDAMELVGVKFEFKQNRDNGFWRLEADGLEFSPCHVVLPDAVLAYVISANVHRRHLNRDDKRNLIAKLIKANPGKSDRQIAETVKVSPTTVGTKRAEMEATGDVSKLDTRTDSKGRKQPARKTTTKPPPVSEEVLQQRAAAAERIRALMGGKTRDDIGPASNDEITRKDARIEELQADKRRLEIENIGLRSEVEETKAVRKPGDEGEGSELGNLLRAWDRASQGAREKFKARVGLVAVEPPAKAMDDGLDIPECLRRAAP
jgi:ParB-like chromosome segregation protein Spo0J